MSKMLAAGSLRRARPSLTARLLELPGRGTTRSSLSTLRTIASCTSRPRILASPRTAYQSSISTVLSQNRASSNAADAELDIAKQSHGNKPDDVETVVHEARQRFRDTLPKGYLTEEEYRLYVRLYGPPLRETTPEDVGIPFSGVKGPTSRPDPASPVLLRELDGEGGFEEVPYTPTKTLEEDADRTTSSQGTLASVDTLTDEQTTHINAVARNEREYHALIKLQKDFEAANLRALREADELVQQALDDATALSSHEDDVLQREIEEARLHEGRVHIPAAALRQLQAAARGVEEQPEEFEDDVELSADPVRTRTHPLTQRGRFATNPKTLLLPQTTFTAPIADLLDRTSITHIREAAEAALGGSGLPNSPSTPVSRKSGPQQAVGLEAGQHKMTPIEADVFIATILPPAYAATMSALVEVRKRLGAEWMQKLIRREGGPRVLDFGGGGAGLAAWQDVLQAEWDVMQDAGTAQGSSPPGKKTVIVGSESLRHRISRFMHNTTFLPRLPDYVHSADIADRKLDAPHEPLPKKTYDVVMVSYALLSGGEGHRRKAMLSKLWSLLSPEGGVLIFVEKGHPRGFEAIADVREKLIGEYLETPADSGVEPTVTDPSDRGYARPKEPGMIVAPCTNHRTCPMYTVPGLSAGRKDFCSFQQRFYRPQFLQQVLRAKHSNHDDVRFSYVAIQRGAKVEGLLVGDEATERAFSGYEDSDEAPHMLSLPRQVLPPLKRKGHVQLEVCTPSGRIERWTVPKSRGKQSYHDARKAAWGDLWALGAKVRTQRQVRLGRGVTESDGGVRAQQAQTNGKRKVRTITVDVDDKGIRSVSQTGAATQRRTKGGRLPPRKSLRDELMDGDARR